jgi:hypothetical protein
VTRLRSTIVRRRLHLTFNIEPILEIEPLLVASSDTELIYPPCDLLLLLSRRCPWSQARESGPISRFFYAKISRFPLVERIPLRILTLHAP